MKTYSESDLLEACFNCDQYHADSCYCEVRDIEIDWEDYPVYDEELDELCDKWKVIVEKKSNQNDGVVITPDCVKFPEFIPNPITLSTDEVIVYIDDEIRPRNERNKRR